MKITREYLKQVIKEELEKAASESSVEEGFFGNLFGKKGPDPKAQADEMAKRAMGSAKEFMQVLEYGERGTKSGGGYRFQPFVKDNLVNLVRFSDTAQKGINGTKKAEPFMYLKSACEELLRAVEAFAGPQGGDRQRAKQLVQIVNAHANDVISAKN